MNYRLLADPLSFDSRQKNPIPFITFSLFVWFHPLILLALTKYFLPNIWNREIASGFFIIIATFLVCHFIFAFGEYFFHRYILHIISIKNMRIFYRKHLRHHTLTPIYFDEINKKIDSAYSINNIDRDECGTFPPWALVAFLSGFSPLLFLMAYIFEDLPILISGYGALSLSYYLYEVTHVRHHYSYDDWWQKKLQSPLLGKVWQVMYGFHQAHHVNYRCNMHVGGFLGLPIGDWLFATYKQPSKILADGVSATREMMQKLNPQPRWPISWLDQRALKRKTRILKN